MSKRAITLHIVLLTSIAVLLSILSRYSHQRNVPYVGSSESFSVTLKKVVSDDGVAAGLSVIPVKIQSVACWLILDTGASHSFLSEEFCEKLSLEGKSIRIARGSNIDADRLVEVKVLLNLGKITLSQFPFTVINLDHLNDISATKISGILGADILNRYIYRVNLHHNTLSILRENDVAVDNADVIPIRIDNNCIYFTLNVAGSLLEFLLDTGRVIPEVDRDCLKNYKGEYGMRHTRKVDINGWKDVAVQRVKLTDFRLGPVHLESSDFDVSDENIMCTKLLELVTITVDPLREQISFASNDSENHIAEEGLE